MKCKCGKECGIKLFCDECNEALKQEFIDIRDRMRKATEKFDKAIEKITGVK